MSSHATLPDSSATEAPATLPLKTPVKAKVLHVVNGEHFSGAERVQDLLALNLPACGYEVGFACVKPDRFPGSRESLDTPLYKLPMSSRFDFACGRRLATLVRDEQYALVHAHTPRSLLVGGIAAKLAGVPLIYHVHSPAGRDSTRKLANFVNAWLERRSARRATRLVAVSPSVRQYMIDAGFPAEQVTYVPNGVPKIDVLPRAAKPETWTLGMAALFRPRKGVEVLLEALASVRSTGLDIRLRAIGPFETPDYEAEVKALAEQLGVTDAIHWTGFVTDIPAELALIDVSVLPSLFGEGLPMVVLEAMAAGVPVIASRVEGVPEAIRHRQDGLLVEPGSVSQLALAIEELAGSSLIAHPEQHPIDYPGMSANAQQRHAECFSAEAMAGNLAQVYDEVLGL
ncbi:glycosyltransferase family 4 protein [Adhaeretor mobilis]|uniref:GDP-mannose-dependent alpha-(1-6)-phosphatidylinositol monomannoside mannosyltransferase n=1 Tax=Adhaeretor mobilis TaxID=1930276 RepID=A0A517MRW4_9BACT|nr:glycosyltransferase family 4 protein [Adhaeretor mobilis]QDS97620.1 GDP-mannose-dependent alpha-(1-6)-phosphatidylinositol monomannoside mannosyltransferase [Adhaeretor mobilis]